MSVVHTSRLRITKYEGTHRTADIESFAEPLHFGLHGAIKRFYEEKYGRAIAGPEYPATFDYIIAGIAASLTGALGVALDARRIPSANNLIAQVEGAVEEVDGVMRITKIRLRYRFRIPAGTREKVNRILLSYAEKCPAYQSIKGCIDCSWDADIEEP